MKQIVILILLCSFTYALRAQLYAPELKIIPIQNNNVGIGIENPPHKLTIYDNNTTFSIIPHVSGVDLFSTGSITPHYQNEIMFYKGIPGNAKPTALIKENNFALFNDSNSFYISNGEKGTVLSSKGFLDPHFISHFAIYQGTSGQGLLSLYINQNRFVGINTDSPQYHLDVNGTIRANDVKTNNTNWPDYVFSKDYRLPSLSEVSKHIEEKQHLPGIPSAKEVEENGINLSEMNAKLLQKIEEMTLYMIQMQKEIDELKKKME